jgi:hypothetical protein
MAIQSLCSDKHTVRRSHGILEKDCRDAVLLLKCGFLLFPDQNMAPLPRPHLL